MAIAPSRNDITAWLAPGFRNFPYLHALKEQWWIILGVRNRFRGGLAICPRSRA
jgi:hypothetical protein